MTGREFCKLGSRLMRQPAAPYHEHAIAREVKTICAEYGLACDEDKFGNLLVSLDARSFSKNARPIVFAAHMDHPGFEVMPGKRSVKVRFLGGVSDEYFRPGLRIRLMPGSTRAILGEKAGKERVFGIRPNVINASAKHDGARSPVRAGDVLPAEDFLCKPLTKPTFAVWDLEDFAIRRGLIHGRSCDDLIGVASALAALVDLKNFARAKGSRARASAFRPIAAISRAEEVGFRGALTLCGSKLIPKDALVISLETSRELPGVKMGKGVILRVGDRTSIFDSDAMRFLSEVAGEHKKSHKSFDFQRALMSGGTCEASAYQEYGYQTGAVCIALGNYHNCAPGRRIAAEYVNISDALSMVDLLVASAQRMHQFQELTRKFPDRLEAMRREAIKKFQETKGRPDADRA